MATSSSVEKSSNDTAVITKEDSQISVVGDVNSPYFLQPSDHPGLIFVVSSLEESGENYFTWRRNMVNALDSKAKTGFVDGTISKPDIGARELNQWIKCNAMVRSWLVNSVTKELQNSVAYAETAREVWKDLDECFFQGNAARMYELRRAIALLQQEKMSVSSYYGKLRGLWDELQVANLVPACTCGCRCGASKKMQTIRKSEKVYDFLIGLDGGFNTVRSQILCMEPLPHLGRTYAIAAQEEKQQPVVAVRIPNVEAAAFMANRSAAPTMNAHGKGGNNWEKPSCDHCKKMGHTKARCFELIGYPPNWCNKSSKQNAKGGQSNNG